MPRDASSMPICSPTKNECVEEAVETVEQTAFDTKGSIGKPIFQFILQPQDGPLIIVNRMLKLYIIVDTKI